MAYISGVVAINCENCYTYIFTTLLDTWPTPGNCFVSQNNECSICGRASNGTCIGCAHGFSGNGTATCKALYGTECTIDSDCAANLACETVSGKDICVN